MPSFTNYAARNVLVDHMDGTAVRYTVPHTAQGAVRKALWAKKTSQLGLVQKGFLQWQGSQYTVITQKGRAELAKILADYAEVLVKAGYANGDLLTLAVRYAPTAVFERRPVAPDNDESLTLAP